MGDRYPLDHLNGAEGLNFTALILSRNSAILRAGSKLGFMAQNYEVFLADKPLLICAQHVEASALTDLTHFSYSSPDDLDEVVSQLLDNQSVKGACIVHSNAKSVWQAFKKRYKRLNAAGGFVLDEQGRLLGIHRLGVWDLPKGKREQGEGFAECAVREVQEECGVTGITLGDKIYTTWHTYEHKGRAIIKKRFGS